ncbi:hypothetical protein [Agromyces humi]|uniref:hypothetical protein n=1 Tax=Agromyces humi TaxID=1766800 RepID=UPI0013587DC5|nr:hypothetical protein [Agromyces humi]
MGKRDPRAHLSDEGGGLVTGTHDIVVARAVMRARLEHEFGADDAAEFDFTTAEPELKLIRSIPARRDDPDYLWYFVDVDPDHQGRPGVTRAVIWKAAA